MNDNSTLIHATAFVAGTTGFLFVGPSGSGKTRLALSCIDGAHRDGHFAALVSDDQVLVRRSGGYLIATAPETIKGMAEIRGSAIVAVDSIAACKLDYAVRSTDPGRDLRLAPPQENYTLAQDAMLPLIRLPIDCIDPWMNLRRIVAAYVAEKRA